MGKVYQVCLLANMSEANPIKNDKVIVQFQATGNAAQLKQKKFKLSAKATFQNVIDFLRKQLRLNESDSLFLFINSTFQPSPDEWISDLVLSFHNNGVLIVNYS